MKQTFLIRDCFCESIFEQLCYKMYSQTNSYNNRLWGFCCKYKFSCLHPSRQLTQLCHPNHVPLFVLNVSGDKNSSLIETQIMIRRVPSIVYVTLFFSMKRSSLMINCYCNLSLPNTRYCIDDHCKN